MTETNDSSHPSPADLPHEPLGRWERLCALTIGVISGSAGAYTVFERSNQAGSVMLLVLAAVFLLIGIQGTPLIKFGSTTASLELERRREAKAEVQHAYEEATEENNSARAQGIVEGVSLIAPELVPANLFTYREYEDGIANVIRELGYEVEQPKPIFERVILADLAISKNNYTVYAEMKMYSRPIPPTTASQIIGISATLKAPVVLIATTQLTNSARSIIENTNVAFVQWRSEKDNGALSATLSRLFNRANGNVKH
jgi:hypothetical protein